MPQPGLPSFSGGSHSPPPLAHSLSSGESRSPAAADLAHSYYGGSHSPPPAHQSPSEDLMKITIKNQLHRPRQYRPSIRDRKLSLFRRKPMTVRPATEVCHLSPSMTVGELRVRLQKRHQLPALDFLLLQEHEDGYPRALFHDNATLSYCHVTHGDTLHLSSSHTFPLRLYDNTPLEDRFIRNLTPDPSFDGRFIHLEPSIYYTVAHLKEMIFSVTGYNIASQLLNPSTTRLHDKDNQTLQSLGFKSSDDYSQLTLYNCLPRPPNQLLPPSTPKIYISVTDSIVGGRFNVSVDPNVKVEELRDEILWIGKTCRLRFGSIVLENDKMLSDYKITHGDIIILSDF